MLRKRKRVVSFRTVATRIATQPADKLSIRVDGGCPRPIHSTTDSVKRFRRSSVLRAVWTFPFMVSRILHAQFEEANTCAKARLHIARQNRFLVINLTRKECSWAPQLSSVCQHCT
jgi:hypothetical protein